MMKWIVKDVAERGGIRNARELAAKTGIPLASMYRIWNGTATRTDLATMEKLCTVLGVVPGQLFDFEPDPSKLPGGEQGATIARKAKVRVSSRKQSTGKSARTASGDNSILR